MVLMSCGANGKGDQRHEPRNDCQDDIVVDTVVPPPLQERLAQAGLSAAVGRGQIWLIAPSAIRWREVVSSAGSGSPRWMLKLPVWVDSAGELPRVTARLVGEDVQDTHAISGRAEPTDAGLPGVVPTGIGFEMAGCWEVSVARGVDAVTIRVGVGLRL